jgi:hypothetical protein
MAKTITEDIRKSLTTGLIVYDQNGEKVGYIDQAFGEQGWMQIRVSEFGRKTLWVPYRLVSTADMREIFVSATVDQLWREYSEPPARTTSVAHLNGKTIATTSERSGYDSKPIRLHQVDVDRIRELIAVNQRVWTSDDVEVGTSKQYDSAAGYMFIEKGHFSRHHDVLVPVVLVADVARDVGEVMLAVRESDLKRMRQVEPVNVIVV